jgi:archaellum component FlaC
MERNLKAIKERIKKLRETSEEVREKSIEFKDSDLKELHLEIECYCNEIDSRIRLINNREVKNGRKS